MSATYNIEVSGDALATLPRLKDAPGLGRALARTMDRQNQLTIAHIDREYLSFPQQGPTQLNGLRVISNRLRASVRASKAIITADGVQSTIGSNVVYAAVHEFGFAGEQHVRAFLRKNFRQTTVSGRHRKIRGADIPVRAFTRQMHLPARRPIGRGIEDRQADYGAAMSRAITTFITGL